MATLTGRDLLCTQDWDITELTKVLELAEDMQKNRFSKKYTSLLENKTFFMFFYNPSVRTRQSFECAATELGGHAQFLEPTSMRLKTARTAGETVEDAANVMSRYAVGLGIRILEDKISYYGQGNRLLGGVREMGLHPDRQHGPRQVPPVPGARGHHGLPATSGRTSRVRSWSRYGDGEPSPGPGARCRRASRLLPLRDGRHARLPGGVHLDPAVIEAVKGNCARNKSKFEITHDAREGYRDAHVVYSRNWVTPEAYKSGHLDKQSEIEKASKHTEWICDDEKMKLTNDALFTHPMPVDRGSEVTDEIASGKRSIIYDVAENRLHVQKAIMALTMAGL